MTRSLRAYRHPSLGFELEVPADAELREDTGGAALVAADPADPSAAFRPSVVVTVEESPIAGYGLERYTDASLAGEAEGLTGFRLIDRETTTVRGGDATRTLAYHDVLGQSVTIEQWRCVVGTRGFTVTMSCWTLDYDVLADGFAAVAATFAA